MCTYATHQCAISGSGKSAVGWFPMTTATVYVDHPVHAQADHTVNIDLAAPHRGAEARVAVELPADSAMQLLSTIAAALLSAPADITGLDDVELSRLRALVADDSARIPPGTASDPIASA